MSTPYWLYILRCADNTLYTGIAKDLDKRLETHAEGRGSKYVYSRRPFELVYSRKYPTRSEALKEEMKIKKLRRDQKKELLKIKQKI